jgi:site-specific DNA-methyltransferase (adenine-specific)
MRPAIETNPKLITPHGVLYKSDCLDLMRSLPSESIDCIFADPPFNLGKQYNNGKSDLLSEDHYLDWCRLWITESIRLLKTGGAMFVYNLPRWAYQMAAYMEQQEMEFRHWIAVSMKGTFPRGNKLYPAHYALLYFTKGPPKTFNRVRLPIPTCRHCGKDIKDYGGHRKYLNPAGLNLTDFWDDTSPARHSKNKSRWHINELKPTIPERCIEISTIPGEIVLDAFGGGGSTYITAERLHRFWIGSEIGPCEPILDRFAREFSRVEKHTAIPEKLRPLFGETKGVVLSK